jgi:HEPN domain-containing protein
MKPLTHEWSQKAEGDYTASETLRQAENPVYDAICFHAQQCVEKYLKAWLTQQEIDFPRTHDLEALAKQCLPSLPDLDALMDELRFLTSFAVEIRYPGTFAEAQDAEACWQTAVRARELIRHHLGIED